MPPARPKPAWLDELRAALPADAVLADAAHRLAYDCDAYTIAREAPAVVVLPRSTREVSEVMRVAHRHGVAVVPRGAGTGLAGGAVPEAGGIVVGLSRMNRVLAVDGANRRATVEAGVVNAQLTQLVAPSGLHFAPDPSSQSACTIGGNIAENAGGPHTLKYGVTVNHVLAVELVLPDGEVVWLGSEFDETPGYDMVGAVVGSEGTLGIVTRAVVRLTPVPEGVRTLLATFPDVRGASGAVSAIIGRGIIPAALEMMDQAIIEAVEAAFGLGLPLDAGAALIVELDGPEAGLDEGASEVEAILHAHGAASVERAADAAARERLWLARKKAVGAVGRLAPSKVTMDGVIPRTRLPEVLEAIGAIAAAHGLRVGNVFHAGDGNLHPLLLFDERDPDQVARVLAAGEEILRVCVEAGGSVTGEHGIGVEKRDHLGLMFDAQDLAAMEQLRRVFDPDERLNPDKLLPVRRGCGEARLGQPRGGVLC
ncbi:MAG: FAD-linked oxidase C-terminal domain-containing protein [Candidatus Sericytochromatia bacterium]|nr:FAD-linked oxidase C-terminal domain-containing protein [Candidatus Sericytochromatia bacterium]